jgi:type 1 glutamine amidotransferase
VALGVVTSLSQSAPGQSCQPFKVLVFTKQAVPSHASQMAAGIAVVQSLGAAHGFVVDQTADATLISTANLSQYAVVIFLITNGDVLNSTQEAAFQAYIMGGGGFVGVHTASATEYGWPFYGALLGAWYLSHPPPQTATVTVVDPTHPSTASLPPTFTHFDEWYDFQTNPASNPLVHVLLTVDESTYSGGMMGVVHPIAWYQDNPGMGRSWYTAVGHDPSLYSNPLFHAHLLGGIVFAAGSPRTSVVCGLQTYGASSGTPPLALGGSIVPPGSGLISISGASPGAPGLLGVSSCQSAATAGGLTILVDLAGPGFVGLFPVSFDALGQWQLPVPATVQLPGIWGNSISLQGAEIGAAIGLSNGLQISLCP